MSTFRITNHLSRTLRDLFAVCTGEEGQVQINEAKNVFGIIASDGTQTLLLSDGTLFQTNADGKQWAYKDDKLVHLTLPTAIKEGSNPTQPDPVLDLHPADSKSVQSLVPVTKDRANGEATPLQQANPPHKCTTHTCAHS